MKDYYYSFGNLQELSFDLPVLDDIDQRFKHLYLVGLSGMGKSTVMENLAHYDISNGHSVIFIDPKGESADKLYYHFKDNDKVEYVSSNKAIKINPFEKHGQDLESLIDEFVQIFDNVITATTTNPHTTVRMREIINRTIPALRPEDRNFKMIYDFLHDKPTRTYYKHYTNDELKTWWHNLFDKNKTEFKKRTDFELSMTSVSSRIDQALSNAKTRSFIEGKNELDIEDIIENNKSLIVNIGDLSFFGRLFVANLIVGAIHSHLHKRKKSKPLFVYIDEFDLVASGEFEETLQLARSSNVGFVLAHQNFSSARSEIHRRMMNAVIETIFGAVSNYIAFNTSPKVAKELSMIFSLTIKDFVELDQYEARTRLGIKKNFIKTNPPKLDDVPDDYVFPTRRYQEQTKINYLRDEWIDIHFE